ncbi:hypothetical protein P3T39_005170 [Kitasatospora sp. GP82]|nr:hypothetical protein [Kitasatospora sp. GP82]
MVSRRSPEAERTSTPRDVLSILVGSDLAFGVVVFGWLPVSFGLSFWASTAPLALGTAVGCPSCWWQACSPSPRISTPPRTGTTCWAGSGRRGCWPWSRRASAARSPSSPCSATTLPLTGGIDISFLLSGLVSAVLYLVLSRSRRGRAGGTVAPVVAGARPMDERRQAGRGQSVRVDS